MGGLTTTRSSLRIELGELLENIKYYEPNIPIWDQELHHLFITVQMTWPLIFDLQLQETLSFLEPDDLDIVLEKPVSINTVET